MNRKMAVNCVVELAGSALKPTHVVEQEQQVIDQAHAIKVVGIKLLDHLVIGHNEIVSISL